MTPSLYFRWTVFDEFGPPAPCANDNGMDGYGRCTLQQWFSDGKKGEWRNVPMAIGDDPPEELRAEKKPKTLATQIPPEIDWMIDHGKTILLPESECVKCFHFHEARGWYSNRNVKFKNWKSVMATWLETYRSGKYQQNGQPPTVNGKKYNPFGD